MAVIYGAARGGPRPSAAYVVLVSAIGALALVTGVVALVAGSAPAVLMPPATVSAAAAASTLLVRLHVADATPTDG
jgi:hypothetical protein